MDNLIGLYVMRSLWLCVMDDWGDVNIYTLHTQSHTHTHVNTSIQTQTLTQRQINTHINTLTNKYT